MALDFVARGALTLTRLAALQGQEVSYHEFERLAHNLDDQTLSGVPMAGKIAALWRERFPLGGVRAPDWPPKPGDVPALWLGPMESEGSLLVVVGALTNGSLSCLDEYGRSMLLRPEQARLGRLLKLESDPRLQPMYSVTEHLTWSQQLVSRASICLSRSLLVLTILLVSVLVALVLRRE